MSDIILNAINILRNCIDGIQIEILDSEMNRKYPDNFNPIGYLGVSISIDLKDFKKYNIFFKYQIAEDICIYGENVAMSYLFDIIKDDFIKFERKLKLEQLL